MTTDAQLYYSIALHLYPGLLTDALQIFPTNVPAARQYAAEMCFVYEHRQTAEWFVYIEHFEYVAENDSFIFAHYDTKTA